jgi:hypothetical protein
MNIKRVLLLALALRAPFASTALASTHTWNSTSTGYWTNGTYWLPVGVPTETDTVIVGKGTVNVPLDPLLALDDLHLYGGKIQGTFDVRGLCDWTNGVIASGTNTVRSNAVLRLVSDATKTFSAVTLNNQGWVAWTNASRIAPEGNSAINNQPGGIFDVQGDGYVNKTAAGTCSFNNYGLFRKTGGTNGTWFSGLPFNNSGAVEIQTGSLSLNSGGTLSGSLVAWAGSQVELASGTFTLSSDVTVINVELVGGTIGGTHTLHGDLSWTGAKLANGSTTIATNCTLRLSGDRNKALSFHNLTNEGSGVWTGTAIINPQGNCVIYNAAGGTFEARGGAGVNTTAGISSFFNSGLFRQAGGTNGTWFDGLPFNSSGTVEIQTGNLWLNGGGTLSGNLVAWPGSQIELAGGTFTLDGDLTALNLKLSGGTAGGTSTLHGQVNWTGGILANGLTTVATNGTLLLSEDTGQILFAHVLNNEGWVVWSNASRLTPKGNCLITNQTGGTFEAWGDGSIDRSGYSGSCTFYNLGTFRKSGGTGQTRVTALPFFNRGCVEVRAGTLHFDTGYTQTSGTTCLDGGAISAATPLDIQGGSVTGSGDVAASLKNAGLLSPGNSIGHINILTNCTETASGVLQIEVAGRSPGQYDCLHVTGTALLAGTLNVTLAGGFTPAQGDSFPVLTCGSLSGTFVNLHLPAGMAIPSTSNGVSLVVTGTPPVRVMGAALSGTNFMFSFSTLPNQSYTVQYRSDLATNDWHDYLSLSGDGALKQVAVPLAEAARRFFRVKQP